MATPKALANRDKQSPTASAGLRFLGWVFQLLGDLVLEQYPLAS